MAKKNTVIGPLVVATNEDGSQHYFYQGAVLPSFVKGDQLKGFVDAGLVGSEEDLVEAQSGDQSGAPADTEPKKAPAK